MNLLTTLHQLRSSICSLSRKCSDHKITTSLEHPKFSYLIRKTRETGSALLTPSSATIRNSVEPNKVKRADLSWKSIAKLSPSTLNLKQLLKKMIVLAWGAITSNAGLKWKRNFWKKRLTKALWWTEPSPRRCKCTMQMREILNYWNTKTNLFKSVKNWWKRSSLLLATRLDEKFNSSLLYARTNYRLSKGN